MTVSVKPPVPDRPWADAGEVTDLVARFEDASLPHAAWTHRAHLTVALWYAHHHAPADALDLMRTGILRLNAVHGVPTTATRGYHETITRFYIHVITHYLRVHGTSGTWAERANRLVEALGRRDLPLRHYSEARLGSPEARARWLEPDLGELPELR
ncbi:MAG: hypothetical protein ACTHM9_04690 [Gemmatimonadales bacterium]